VAFTPWSYVDSLTESGPNQLVFTTNVDADGNVSIEFGDGINGAIPPANQVISALYRISAGAAGNLNSGTIEEVTFIPGNIVPEAIGYLAVSNPSAAFGGADGDDNDQIRAKVKNAITTRRRAVTLSDYAALASQVSGVGRTKSVAAVYSSVTLYLQTQNDDSVTPGIVSGSPTASWTSLSSEVSSYLSDKIPVGTTVSVQPPTYVDFYVTLTVVANAAFNNSDIEQEIRDVFLNPGGLFAYESVDFGQLVAYSAVMSKAASVPGVQSVIINKLNTDNSSSASTAGVQLTSGQIPVLQTTNLIINVSGGLS
jgi:predicted phage baseplate assembly protein